MPIIDKSLTILELINRTIPYFKENDIENPRLNAEQLLSHVLNIDRIQLYLQYDRVLLTEEISRFREYVRRRAMNEPLQYIVGETEFMGLKFFTTPAALIPRPETEILIERTLQCKKILNNKNPRILDIGTGSGCIAVSIAVLWPESTVIATDISEDSLLLAKKNADLNGVMDSINFIKHNIQDDPLDDALNAEIIVSNPPYVSLEEFKSLADEIREHEPHLALTDNKDGLNFYKKIFSIIQNGYPCNYILLELSGTQTTKILNESKKLNAKNLEVFDDLNDIPRVLQITI